MSLTSLKKAGSSIKKSFRNRRYDMFQAKENNYIDSPSQSLRSRREAPQSHHELRGDKDCHSLGQDLELDQNTTMNTTANTTRGLKRGSSVTQSMRVAVGTIRQRLRMSTRRRAHLSEFSGTPTRAGKRRHSLAGISLRGRKADVKMSSPFKIETPSGKERTKIKTCLSMETPTRLRKEVEDLTSNMQALSTLTPNTLHTRRSTRLSPPITNGSLKTPRASRRRITTDIY